MKKIIFICLATISLAAFGFGQSAQVKTDDLQILTGAQWTGNLTYLDYGTKKMVSIPSRLNVTRSKEDKTAWIFDYQYPDEPKANRRATVTLSQNGELFDGEKVVEKAKLDGKNLKIVTEKSGTDNDRKAVFRFTYLIDKTVFSIKKEVRYEEIGEFFVRNQYDWKR